MYLPRTPQLVGHLEPYEVSSALPERSAHQYIWRWAYQNGRGDGRGGACRHGYLAADAEPKAADNAIVLKESRWGFHIWWRVRGTVDVSAQESPAPSPNCSRPRQQQWRCISRLQWHQRPSGTRQQHRRLMNPAPTRPPHPPPRRWCPETLVTWTQQGHPPPRGWHLPTATLEA